MCQIALKLGRMSTDGTVMNDGVTRRDEAGRSNVPGGPLRATCVRAAEANAAETSDELIFVLHPNRDDYEVVSGGGNAPLRAAVSVAVAAGNMRIWDGASVAAVTTRPVTSLPEVVRAIADGAGVTEVDVAPIGATGQPTCVALWFDFESEPSAGRGEDRRALVDELIEATEADIAEEARQAAIDAEVEAARAAEAAAAAAADVVDLPVGSTSDDIDALTGLASRERFDRAMEDFDGEEATLLLIDLDGFTAVNEDHGSEAADEVLRETARRLASTCRRNDVVARLHADDFAIVLTDADRATALQVSKRLLTVVAEPQPALGDGRSVTATLAFAHEFGLVDMDELYESAEDALSSGKRAGSGRIVVAS